MTRVNVNILMRFSVIKNNYGDAKLRLNSYLFNAFVSVTGVTAFSVMRGGGASEYVGPNIDPTTIVFDEVQFVIGEGFDTLSSIFTAPVGGLYLFMHGNQNGDDGVSVTAIHLNDIRRYNKIDTPFEAGIQTALLMLSPGDQVYVLLEPNNEIFCFRCYFDGVLLYQSL